MEGAVIVWDGMGMSRIAKLPIKASVNSSKSGEGQGVTGFKRVFVGDDVGVGGFVETVIGVGGAVTVDHLSG